MGHGHMFCFFLLSKTSLELLKGELTDIINEDKSLTFDKAPSQKPTVFDIKPKAFHDREDINMY